MIIPNALREMVWRAFSSDRWRVDPLIESILSHSDGTYFVTMTYPCEIWEDIKYRAGATHDMHHYLIDKIIEAGGVPISLPTETIRYMSGYPGHEVSKGMHDSVEVTLSVGVRKCT